MNITDFAAQIEKDYGVTVLRNVSGAPVINAVSTDLARQYSNGGLIVSEIFGYSEYSGGIREPFKITVTNLKDAPDSYALASDGAAQLKYRNVTAQQAAADAKPTLTSETIKAIQETVIKADLTPVIIKEVLP